VSPRVAAGCGAFPGPAAVPRFACAARLAAPAGPPLTGRCSMKTTGAWGLALAAWLAGPGSPSRADPVPSTTGLEGAGTLRGVFTCRHTGPWVLALRNTSPAAGGDHLTAFAFNHPAGRVASLLFAGDGPDFLLGPGHPPAGRHGGGGGGGAPRRRHPLLRRRGDGRGRGRGRPPGAGVRGGRRPGGRFFGTPPRRARPAAAGQQFLGAVAAGRGRPGAGRP